MNTLLILCKMSIFEDKTLIITKTTAATRVFFWQDTLQSAPDTSNYLKGQLAMVNRLNSLNRQTFPTPKLDGQVLSSPPLEKA